MVKAISSDNIVTQKTIQKTLLTAALQEGFWDRWIAHGIEREIIESNRTKLVTLNGFIEVFENQAKFCFDLAENSIKNNEFEDAEKYYRLSALYFNLIQWVFPEPSEEKLYWYDQSLLSFQQADRVSNDKIEKHILQINEKIFVGRIRQPHHTLCGVIIIINPIDSTKEELYTYEHDFAKANFGVVSFDGPGQGETLLKNKHKADKFTWTSFVKGIIEYASFQFPALPIYLFGTSSGGAWALEGAKHPLVSKTISVSPAPKHDIKMPDFFRERMSNMLEKFENGFLPELKELQKVSNVLFFHGEQDVMVDKNDLLHLFKQISNEKRFITYKNEGHCCNFKLPEVRQRTIKWLKGESIDGI
ncbi:alpha/beta hydrolase [Ureibacillus chungkukjangi]|uniref:alpha/beta hydrolase n=1 Tax=Ureibacillus chungkukjangi TaxID=1202712 RepID=UPI00203ACF6E|nr:alpha/beta hydrolase [Ureibacillus chungkukjangi]MCM3390380.1 alpha/beta hydrolase [Ureibacillus chungkukjangi]